VALLAEKENGHFMSKVFLTNFDISVRTLKHFVQMCSGDVLALSLGIGSFTVGLPLLNGLHELIP